MQRIGRVVDHGLDRHAAAEGHGHAILIGGVAQQHVHVNVDDGPVASRVLIFGRDGLARHIVHAVPGPDAQRQAHQRHFAGQGAIFSLGQLDVHNVLHSVDIGGRALGIDGDVITFGAQFLILDLEAGGHIHVRQLPGVGSVQADVGLDGLHSAHVAGLEVNVVDGIILGGQAGIVVTGHVDQGFVLRIGHGEGGVLLGLIAHAVSDFEGHHVLAIFQRNICRSGHDIAGNLGLNLHAVHIDLRSGSIDADVIVLGLVVVDIGGEHRAAGGNSLAVQLPGVIRGSIHDGTDDGLLAVIHGLAVVQGHVVEVEGQLLRIHRLDVHANEGGRTRILIGGVGVHGGQVLIRAHINVRVHPAAGGNVRFHHIIEALHRTAGILEQEVLLIAAISLAIILGAPELGHEGQTTLNALAGIIRVHNTCRAFGDVHPEAEGSGLLLLLFGSRGKHITEHMLLTHEEQVVVAPAREVCIGIVQRPAQRIAAVLDLAIAAGCQEGLCRDLVIVLTSQRSAAYQRVVHAVVDAPLLGSLKAHPIGDVAVFEVPGTDQFGALAVGDDEGQLRHLRRLVGRSDGHALHLFIGGGSVAHRRQIQSTGSLIAHFPSESIGGEVHGEFLRRILVHFNLQRSALAVGQHRAVQRKPGNRRIGHREGLLSSLLLHSVLNRHLTQLAVGGEHAVLADGTVGGIRQRPDAALGHLPGVAQVAHRHRFQRVDGIGRDVFVLGQNDRAGELFLHLSTAAGALDSQEDGVQGGTLGTVRGGGAHHQTAVTRTAGDEGGGTAAVAVDRPNAAQRQHQLAHLVVGQTGGNSAVTAVTMDDHQRAVGLDAQHGAGGVRGGTLNAGGHQLAILDQPAEVGAHNEALLGGAVLAVVQRIGSGAQITGAVIIDGQVGLAARVQVFLGVVLIHQHLVLKHEEAVGLVVVIRQGDVHAADQLIAQRILVVPGGLGHFHGSPGTIIFGVKLVVGIVTGQHVHLGSVHGENVHFLTVGAGGIVQNDFGLSSAGNHGVLVFLDNDEVVVADAGVVPAAGAGNHHGHAHLGSDLTLQLHQEAQLGLVLRQDDSAVFLGQLINGNHHRSNVVIALGQLFGGHHDHHGLEQHPQFALELAVVLGDHILQLLGDGSQGRHGRHRLCHDGITLLIKDGIVIVRLGRLVGLSGLVHDGLVHNGLVHDGLVHNGLVHDGLVHNGLVHNGLIHDGLVHNGLIHDGLIHHGLIHNGLIHNGLIHGLIHDGLVHGLIHNGLVHDGSRGRGGLSRLRILAGLGNVTHMLELTAVEHGRRLGSVQLLGGILYRSDLLPQAVELAVAQGRKHRRDLAGVHAIHSSEDLLVALHAIVKLTAEIANQQTINTGLQLFALGEHGRRLFLRRNLFCFLGGLCGFFRHGFIRHDHSIVSGIRHFFRDRPKGHRGQQHDGRQQHGNETIPQQLTHGLHPSFPKIL